MTLKISARAATRSYLFMANDSPRMLATTFGLALATEDWPWAQSLLSQGADLEACKYYAASSNDPVRACALLARHGASFGPEDYFAPPPLHAPHDAVRTRLIEAEGISHLLDLGIAVSSRALPAAAECPTLDARTFERLLGAAPKPWPGALANACKACLPDKIIRLVQSGADPTDVLPERADARATCIEACFIRPDIPKPRREHCLAIILNSNAELIARPARSERDADTLVFRPDDAPTELNLAKNICKLQLAESARLLAAELWNPRSSSRAALKARDHLIAKFGLHYLTERDAIVGAVSEPSSSKAMAPRL